jgi:hypothetical protein
MKALIWRDYVESIAYQSRFHLCMTGFDARWGGGELADVIIMRQAQYMHLV